MCVSTKLFKLLFKNKVGKLRDARAGQVGAVAGEIQRPEVCLSEEKTE